MKTKHFENLEKVINEFMNSDEIFDNYYTSEGEVHYIASTVEEIIDTIHNTYCQALRENNIEDPME